MRFQLLAAGGFGSQPRNGNRSGGGCRDVAEDRPALQLVEILPPTASRMTVCYGFVCRLRYIFDFTPGDRRALTEIMNKGKASPEAERKAVQ